MIHRLFPPSADNLYRGYRLALWLFGLVVLMKGLIALNSIFNGHAVAASADGIPIETFTSAGTQTVVGLFALLGLWQLLFCTVGALVLVRYRALVPLMFTLLLLQHMGKALILQVIPVAMAGSTVRSAVTLTLLALMVLGLVLSMSRPAHRRITE